MSIRSTMKRRAFGWRSEELTGRRVLAMLVGFFLLIFTVNGMFIYFSLSSHPGTTARDAYREGLEYNRLLEQAERQRALGWRARIQADGGAVRLRLRDAGGAPVSGLVGKIDAGRPASDADDRTFATVETAPGIYEAEGPPFLPGRWRVAFEMRDAAGRRFRAEDIVWMTQ